MRLLDAEVRVGTSGYSFRDWTGPFYPPGTSGRARLPYYARHFDTVELNSPYYGIMPPSTTEGMVARTPDGFRFSAKLHSSMTHGRDAGDGEWSAYAEMIRPLVEAGRLSCCLAQFPYSFRASREAADYVLGLTERLAPVPLAVEFRHDSWYAPEVLERLASAGVSPVSVDLPELGHLPPRAPIGGGLGYVRFHGRNARQWWDGGALRYDWSYSREELAGWMPGLRWLARRSDTLFLFFNNCHAGKAIDGARIMIELLEGER
jgi:uncharacterized protein YecE (DUF72 family)